MSSENELLAFLKNQKFKKIFVLSGNKSLNLSGAKHIIDRAFKKGGRVKAKEGFFAKEDESIGERLGKGKATAKNPKKAKKYKALARELKQAAKERGGKPEDYLKEFLWMASNKTN